MYTFGGLIGSHDFQVSHLNLSQFEFINLDEIPYIIEVPNLTRKEVELINSHLIDKENELIELNIITELELSKFKKIYKYMPHYYDIRL